MITRKITASPVKVTGLAPDGQAFESSLEEDYFFLLRFRQDVVRFSRPTESITWHDDAGKQRSYTPDVLIELRQPDARLDSPALCALVEIKPNFNDLDNPKARLPRSEDEAENKLKWAAATNFARMRGWEFSVVREDLIRTPLLSNVKFLMRALERPSIDRGRDKLLKILRQRGPMPLECLMESAATDLNERALLYPTLYACIAKHVVLADLSVRLSAKTMLSVADGA